MFVLVWRHYPAPLLTLLCLSTDDFGLQSLEVRLLSLGMGGANIANRRKYLTESQGRLDFGLQRDHRKPHPNSINFRRRWYAVCENTVDKVLSVFSWWYVITALMIKVSVLTAVLGLVHEAQI